MSDSISSIDSDDSGFTLDDEFRGPPCPVCSKVSVIRDPPISYNVPILPIDYHIDPDPAARTTMDGWALVCDLCALVRDLDKHWSGSDYNGPARSRENPRSDQYLTNCGRVLTSSWRGLKHEFSLSVNHNAANDVFQLLKKKPRYGVVYADPLSAPVVGKWQRWLEACETQHEECRSGANFMPTRVLDIQNLPYIKLIDTNGLKCHYTALSHCWGRLNKFMTTALTLPSMRLGFMIDDIPATFRDAVLVTQTLGVQYLWIDSLCIIQGDKADLAQELSMMGDVYANSYVTITGANISDDTLSFLKERPFDSTLLRIVSNQGNVAEVYLQNYDSRSRFFDQIINNPFKSFATEPLDHRAWALQERYLPRRVLYFGTPQIIWRCQQWNWDESEAKPNFHEYQPYEADNPSEHGLWTVRDLQPRQDEKTGNILQSYEPWYTMIENKYSPRSMSYENDKLTALGGLASYLARKNNATYCAGLWWDDMVFGLFWSRNYLHAAFDIRNYVHGKHIIGNRQHSWPDTIPRPSTWRAPSWSWASINGPVSFIERWEYNILDSVNLKHCFIEPKYGNPYTELKSGYLEIQAPVLPFTWLDNDTSDTQDGVITFYGYPDSNDEDQGGISAVILLYSGSIDQMRALNCIMARKTNRSSQSYERIGLLKMDFLSNAKAALILENAPVTNIRLI